MPEASNVYRKFIIGIIRPWPGAYVFFADIFAINMQILWI